MLLLREGEGEVLYENEAILLHKFLGFGYMKSCKIYSINSIVVQYEYWVLITSIRIDPESPIWLN